MIVFSEVDIHIYKRYCSKRVAAKVRTTFCLHYSDLPINLKTMYS